MRPCLSSRDSTLDHRRVAAWTAVVILGTVSAALAAPPMSRPLAARPGTMVDPAVVPAGGAPCRHCGAEPCPVHRAHLTECRDGLCAPHCPVRPSQYGFYRTQWRRWPDQGVKQVGGEEAVTPVPPPKSLVPTMDEESPVPPADASAPGDAEGPESTSSGDQPARPAPGDESRPVEPTPKKPARVDGNDEAIEAPNGRVAPVPPGDQPVPPLPEDAGRPDQSSAPAADAGVVAEVGDLRYPLTVGGSLAAGAIPWRLQPTMHQRPADSARGL
jgi:hypothetical protein